MEFYSIVNPVSYLNNIMSIIDDSDLDMNLGDIDECTNIQMRPSVQTNAFITTDQSVIQKEENVKDNHKKNSSNYHDVSRTNCSIGVSHKSRSTAFNEDMNYEEKFKSKLNNKNHLTDIPKRLYKFQDKVNEKVKRLVKEKEKTEMNECSFKPSVASNGKTRTVQTFLEHMQKHTDNKNKKIEKIKEERKKSPNESDNKVKLSKKTQEILSKKSTEKTRPLESKISPVIKKNDSTKNANFSFQPRINNASRKLNREESVDKALYKDAIKRAMVTKSPPVSQARKLSSPKSENVLVKKLNSEYSKIISEIDFDNSGLLKYTKFCAVMKKMRFLNPGYDKTNHERELILKAWKFLGGNEISKVSKANLNTFLLAIMNLSKKTRASSNDNIITGMKNGTLYLSIDNVRKINKEYNILYQNRKNSSNSSAENIKLPLKPIQKPENEIRKDCFIEKPSIFKLKPAGPIKNEIIYTEWKGENESNLSTNPKTKETPDRKENQENIHNYLTQSLPLSISEILNEPYTEENKLNEKSFYEFSKPTLSIPKITFQKGISLRSASLTPEGMYPQIKFSYHSGSSGISKHSPTFSLVTSESELTNQSIINPLVTPPSHFAGNEQKKILFHEPKDLGINSLHSNKRTHTAKGKSEFIWKREKILTEKIKTSKRYKCQSPESFEDSDESILVTVILPDDSEQYIRIHKDDDLRHVLKTFGRKHKLESDQIRSLREEILSKLQ